MMMSLPERKLLINPPFSCAGLCTLSRVIWSSRWSVAKPGSCLENSTMSWTVRIVISVMCLNLMSLVSSPSKLNWRKETEATLWGNDRKWFTRSKGTLMVRVFRYTVFTSSVYLQVRSVQETRLINWNTAGVLNSSLQVVNICKQTWFLYSELHWIVPYHNTAQGFIHCLESTSSSPISSYMYKQRPL